MEAQTFFVLRPDSVVQGSSETITCKVINLPENISVGDYFFENIFDQFFPRRVLFGRRMKVIGKIWMSWQNACYIEIKISKQVFMQLLELCEKQPAVVWQYTIDLTLEWGK
jgi:hypothetical protein